MKISSRRNQHAAHTQALSLLVGHASRVIGSGGLISPLRADKAETPATTRKARNDDFLARVHVPFSSGSLD